jgi:protein-S-isoprenylcysteine O-methyltransferase Ste14
MSTAAMRERSLVARASILLYGVGAYGLFLALFLYWIAFVADVGVPRSVDSGPLGPVALAVLVNLGLVALFAVQHTIMARRSFKRWWTRIVPEPAERSTFVLATVAVFGTLFALWRPIPTVVWQVDEPGVRGVLWGLCAFGWLLLLASTFMIDHFDLFGLRHVWLAWRKKPYTPVPFQSKWAYRYVRQPMMLGVLIAHWATPTMTAGHLLFAAAFTAYIAMGVWVEERSLAATLGPDYARYREEVPLYLPRLPSGPGDTEAVQPG